MKHLESRTLENELSCVGIFSLQSRLSSASGWSLYTVLILGPKYDLLAFIGRNFQLMTHDLK